MDSFKKLVGQRIAKRRIEMGYSSQAKLAEALDIDTSRVSNYETGKNTPKGRLLKKILKCLNMSEGQLLSPSNDVGSLPNIKDLDPRDIASLYIKERARNEQLEALLKNDEISRAFEAAEPHTQFVIRNLLHLPETTQLPQPSRPAPLRKTEVRPRSTRRSTR